MPTEPTLTHSIEELTRLLQVVSPEPWNCFGDRLYYRGNNNIMGAENGGACWIINGYDALFITKSRTAIPQLLSLLEHKDTLLSASQARVKELEERLSSAESLHAELERVKGENEKMKGELSLYRDLLIGL